jgi:hypothetical protein
VVVDQREGLSSGRLLAAAARDLIRPPFITLLAIDLFASVASITIVSDDEASFIAGLALLAISVYITIAVILAAGARHLDPSADAWIRAALRRRVFWRVILAWLFSLILIGLGLVAIVVGGIVVAGYVGLSQVAAVLERAGPADAIRRSSKLTEPARAAVAIVTSLCFLLPGAISQAGVELDWDQALGWVWIPIIIVLRIVSVTGDIALTHAFIALGGEPTPPMSELRPQREPA